MKKNPFDERLAAFAARMEKLDLDIAIVADEANILSLAGVKCDSACLAVTPRETRLFTDFRYFAEIRRTAPWIKTGDISRLGGSKPFSKKKFSRVGYESSIAHSRFLKFEKAFPGAEFVDVLSEVSALRAVKTTREIDAIREAAELNDRIWREVSAKFKPGMTERDMAREIKLAMVRLGDGEAFATIVCIGRNAAECHHVPDDTVWNGKEPILVDMGVKLRGYCSDMTRCIKPARKSAAYSKVYDAVLEANRLATAAAKPGMTGRELDAIARRHLSRCGFGKAFGHSLGHGVGFEVHEAPAVSKKSKSVLEPGMIVTIEPGVYLEGNLGVRIEDLVVITEDGCEPLSHSAK
jgi:Xaa-Pro aminopeptidase